MSCTLVVWVLTAWLPHEEWLGVLNKCMHCHFADEFSCTKTSFFVAALFFFNFCLQNTEKKIIPKVAGEN